MPISNRISVAAASFNQNAAFLVKSVEGLADDDWIRRPGDRTNHLLWIVSHLVWSRTKVLARLGAPWSLPWMDLYARGEKCADSPDCPSPAEALQAWNETCARLNAAMEAATEEALDAPAPKGPPSIDGKVSGTVNFMAYHETYHVGQAAYIRCWLGRAGIMG